MDHYLPDETYHALVRALLNLEPCPVTGEPADYLVHWVLGEIGSIWPASVKEDAGELPFAA